MTIMPRFVLFLTSFSICIALGCGTSEPEPDLSAYLDDPAEQRVQQEPERMEFDFGTVVARDQTLRHEFRLEN